MPITTFSSRDVTHTDRGKPADVSPSIEGRRRLTGGRRNIVDALSTPGLAETEFEPPRLKFERRVPDLS